MKYDYNNVAIGGGAGGLVTAYIGAAMKAKVALIEKHKMGGDCLNTGCVPSKALIRTASLLSMIKRHEEFGIASARAEIDFAAVMERVQRVIRAIEPHDSIERYTKLGVDCITGEAYLRSPHEVEVNGKVLSTRSVTIATGARPFLPPIPGMDDVDVLHTDNIWELREQPKSLLVIGGGPIGSELAQAFARLGSKVTLVEGLATILNREDAEVIELLQTRFREEGIELHTQTMAKAFEKRPEGKVLIAEKRGERVEIPFDRVLVAIGRQPNTASTGLDKLGIKLSDRGLIETDAYARTSVPNIYACGDCTSPYQFTHMAAHQAWYCAVNSLLAPFWKFRVDHSVVPWCTYTDPEVARVGLNEKDAQLAGVPYEVTTYGIEDLDRAIADSEAQGLVKVLTVPGKDRILGATICGHHADDLLPEFVTAMKHKLGLNAILGTIHAYPTMSEANKYAAGEWRRAHQPAGILRLLERFWTWRRG
jgi:dihydrolipoamide dehydrogenase